jgi:hypothetical protein
MKIKFIKLFQIPTEGEIWSGIICYRKRPHEIYSHGEGTGGGQTILSYEKVLRINLWLIEIYFRWIEKV